MSDIKNVSDLLISSYRNDLSKTDLIPVYRKIVLNDAIVLSSILKYVTVVNDRDIEVFNKDGSSAFTFTRQTTDCVKTVLGEYVFRRNGLDDIIPQELTQELAETLDKAIYTYLNSKATSVSATKTTTVEKIVELKNSKFKNKDFILGLGLQQYLDIKEKFNGTFPYQVVYIPYIEDGSILAFKKIGVYANIILESIEMKKNVLAGTYTFVLPILDFKIGCKDVFKI